MIIGISLIILRSLPDRHYARLNRRLELRPSQLIQSLLFLQVGQQRSGSAVVPAPGVHCQFLRTDVHDDVVPRFVVVKLQSLVQTELVVKVVSYMFIFTLPAFTQRLPLVRHTLGSDEGGTELCLEIRPIHEYLREVLATGRVSHVRFHKLQSVRYWPIIDTS